MCSVIPEEVGDGRGGVQSFRFELVVGCWLTGAVELMRLRGRRGECWDRFVSCVMKECRWIRPCSTGGCWIDEVEGCAGVNSSAEAGYWLLALWVKLENFMATCCILSAVDDQPSIARWVWSSTSDWSYWALNVENLIWIFLCCSVRGLCRWSLE